MNYAYENAAQDQQKLAAALRFPDIVGTYKNDEYTAFALHATVPVTYSFRESNIIAMVARFVGIAKFIADNEWRYLPEGYVIRDEMTPTSRALEIVYRVKDKNGDEGCMGLVNRYHPWMMAYQNLIVLGNILAGDPKRYSNLIKVGSLSILRELKIAAINVLNGLGIQYEDLRGKDMEELVDVAKELYNHAINNLNKYKKGDDYKITLPAFVKLS